MTSVQISVGGFDGADEGIEGDEGSLEGKQDGSYKEPECEGTNDGESEMTGSLEGTVEGSRERLGVEAKEGSKDGAAEGT